MTTRKPRETIVSHYEHHKLFACHELTTLLPFNEGNVAKYLYRAGHKDAVPEELSKAIDYAGDLLLATPEYLYETTARSVDQFLLIVSKRIHSDLANYGATERNIKAITHITLGFSDIKIGKAFGIFLGILLAPNYEERKYAQARLKEILL